MKKEILFVLLIQVNVLIDSVDPHTQHGSHSITSPFDVHFLLHFPQMSNELLMMYYNLSKGSLTAGFLLFWLPVFILVIFLSQVFFP